MVAPESVTYGVSVNDVTLLATLTVYAVVLAKNDGVNVPELRKSALRVETVFTATTLVIVNVYVRIVASQLVHTT